MTQTPLERAARAVGQNLYVEANVEIARAVLMAIREPSDAMVDKGSDIPCDDHVSGGVIYSTAAETKAAWQAMIDAALEES